MPQFLLSFLLAISTAYSYPISERRCDLWQTWPGQVFSFDPLLNHIRFSFPCPDCVSQHNPQSAINDEFLVFDASVLSRSDESTSEQSYILTLNTQDLPIVLPVRGEISTRLTLPANDSNGDLRSVNAVVRVRASETAQLDLSEAASLSSLTTSIELRSVDGRQVDATSFTLTFDLSDRQSRALLIDSTTGGMVDLHNAQSSCSTTSLDESAMSTVAAEEEYIATEMEAIRLLEQDVTRLQEEITSRKDAASVRLAVSHSQIPLDVLVHRCDSIVCTARAIANRIYERLTLTLSANDGYQKIQSPLTNPKISINSSTAEAQQKRPTNATQPGSTFVALNHGPTDFLLRALAYIASLLGLAGLFTCIRNKCMSVRKRTERAADLEERRTARAYRRAARRAEMRRRWSAFKNLFAVCRCKPAAPTHNYDEKRAIILQEALLEQNPEILEKGDIMEAEIRQLRHAQSINSEIEQRKAFSHLVKDPPPALVPLPYSSSRSRSSTNTLPSYDSASLPDYSSLPDGPDSESYVPDGFANYSPPTSDDGLIDYDENDTSHRTRCTHRSTPISSVAGLSPRASAETLRTRTTVRSRAGSRDML